MDSNLFIWLLFVLNLNVSSAKSIRASHVKKSLNNKDSNYIIKFVKVEENDTEVSAPSRQKRSMSGLMDRFLEAYNNPGK